jgi:acetyltransferase
MGHVLDPIFNPRSIAVIGASTKPNAIGATVMRNLIDGGYQGALYPIHPTAPEINARKAYASVCDVPGPVDVAVFCVPEKLVLACARDCAKKGVKGYVVITSGFSEVGNKAAEEELQTIAAATGVRIVGPNIVGILSNTAKANYSFAPMLPYAGKTAMVSQSGALLIALDTATFVRNLGISTMVCLGNMSDIDFGDCIDYYAQDAGTSAISLYIEGVKNGRKFIEAGRRAGKPILAIKAGVSAHGAAAAASHTGSLAGSAKVYQAAFKQAHVIEARDLDEFLDRSTALSMQPPMRRGENILVITNGGGVGVLSSDSAEFYGIPLHTAPADLQTELRKSMPDFGSPKNPVDITGGNGAKGYEMAVETALKSDWVHGIAILYCETAVTKPMEIADSLIKTIQAFPVKDKPIAACLVGGELCVAASKKLMEAGIPSFDAPSKTMGALAALREVARFEDQGHDEFKPWVGAEAQKAARAVIASVRADGRTAMTEPEAKKVFQAYGLNVTGAKLAKTADEAVKAAAEIGYPVVMKIVSPQIIHKSDAGGVKVNIKDEAGVRAAFTTILANAKAYKADATIHGILVCEMAPLGREVIAGSVCDATFGPTVMVGLGGIFVEVMKDVTFRVAPFSPETVKRMLPELKTYALLEGVRGEKRRDIEALGETVSRLSQLVTDLGDEIAETDANPVMLYEQGQGLKVVDARIILRKK